MLFDSKFFKLRYNKVLLFFQSPNNGGTRTYFYLLTQYFLENNIKIHLIIDSGEASNELLDYCEKHSIRIQFLPRNFSDLTYRGRWLSKGGINFLFKFSQHYLFLLKAYLKVMPSFVYVSSGWPFTWFKILLLPGPKFYIQHVMPLHYLDRGNGLLLNVTLFLSRTLFIAVSDFCANKMKYYWLRNYKRVLRIYNYYEIKYYYDKPEKDFVQVLALARVEEGKSPFLWIDIAKEILKVKHNVMFIWAGEGSLLKEARKLCSDTDKIKFIGFVEDVDRLYAESDIYFEPTKREAHGISVVGALAWRLPIVTTPNGGTVESVLDGVNGFVIDVENITILKKKLTELINNRSLREAMGREGESRFLNLFKRERWEREMNILLRKGD